MATFPKRVRLRKRQDFKRMAEGQRHVGQWIVLSLRQTEHPFPRLGITVTRQFGKSHLRNRFKRIVREAFRLSLSHITHGVDILIRPRSFALGADMNQIKDELNALLAKYDPNGF